MTTSKIRAEIHEYVDHADDRFLSLLYSMVQSEKGMKPQDQTGLQKMMISRAEQSEQEIAEGKSISAQQFNTEFEQWKRERRASIK